MRHSRFVELIKLIHSLKFIYYQIPRLPFEIVTCTFVLCYDILSSKSCVSDGCGQQFLVIWLLRVQMTYTLVLNLSVERRCLDKKQSKCFTFFLSVLG